MLTNRVIEIIFYVRISQIWQQKEEFDKDWHTCMKETPYAHGIYTDLTGVTIDLSDGFKYRFEVLLIVDGCNQGENLIPYNLKYSRTEYSYLYEPQKDWYEFDSYYGELTEYTPTEGGTAEIYMKRVSYGAKYVVSNLTEGTMSIEASTYYGGSLTLYSVDLTPEKPEYDSIYTFCRIQLAYEDIAVHDGVNPETGESVYEYTDGFEETYLICVAWSKADGTKIYWVYAIPFKRNVKSIVHIKVEDFTLNNGIKVVMEHAPMRDDENGDDVEGGEVILTPIDEWRS